MSMKKEIESTLDYSLCEYCKYEETAENICWIFDNYIDKKIKFFEELKKQQSREEQLLLLPIFMMLNDLKEGIWNDKS